MYSASRGRSAKDKLFHFSLRLFSLISSFQRPFDRLTSTDRHENDDETRVSA